MAQSPTETTRTTGPSLGGKQSRYSRREQIQTAGGERSSTNAQPADEKHLAGDDTYHGAERVPSIQAAQHAAERALVSQQRLGQQRQRDPHRGRRNQQQEKRDEQAKRVERPRVIEQRTEERRQRRAENWKEIDEADA